MVELSFIVTPVRNDKSVLEGAVKLSDEFPLLASYKEKELYERATKHLKRGSTLQSLAINIYLEALEREGITLDARQLKLDLQKLRKWEDINLKDKPASLRISLLTGRHNPPASLPPIPTYSRVEN